MGTFAIVFFGCGAIATTGFGAAGHLTVNLVFGLVVCASIYTVGHVSGAHFNPAVTLGFASVGRFSWSEVPAYMSSQAFAAVAASGLHRVLLPEQALAARFGATVPTVSIAQAGVIEVLLTAFLMFVIVGTATDKRANPAVPGLAIGAAVALCGLFGGPLTGCSMNPARSLGPALFAGGEAIAVLWLYVVFPCIGATLGARAYEAVREREFCAASDEG